MKLVSETHTVVIGDPGKTESVPPGTPFDGDRSLVERGIAKPYKGKAKPAGKEQEPDPDPVNINTATAEQLAEVIPRVGEHTAADIVKHRESQPFQSLDDLVEVGGVGKESVDKVRHLLTI